VVLVIFPVWHSTNNLSRITLLATDKEPVLVIQDKGKVTLVNSGDEGTGRFTILPFLQQQGINQIESAISSKFLVNENGSWLEILQSLAISNFYTYKSNFENTFETQAIQQKIQQQKGIYQSLSSGQTVNTGSSIIQFVNDNLPILRLQIFGQNWLLIGSIKSQQIEQLVKTGVLSIPTVLWCPPESLQYLVTALKPRVAIASHNNLDSKTLADFQKENIQLFFTGRDGAIQWIPDENDENDKNGGKFEAFIQVPENKSSGL
jgi:competence protein ComEC